MPSKSAHNHTHLHEHKLVNQVDPLVSPEPEKIDGPDEVGAQVRELAELSPTDDFVQSPSLMSWIVCLFIFFLGIAIFAFSLRNSSIKTSTEVISTVPTPTQILTPTTTPAASPTLAKSTARVIVLNGTGVPGLAGKVKTELENIGYSAVSTGNSSQAESGKNILSYKSGFEDIATDISTKLSSAYSIEVTKSLLPESSDSDIEIILGQK